MNLSELEGEIQTVEKFVDSVIEKSGPVCMSLLFALVVLIGGLIAVKMLIKLLNKGRIFNKLEDGAAHFIISFIKISLNIVVIMSAAMIMGFPAASIVTILGSAGVAIGLALQGSLSNLAGGLMLIIFKPFKIGDYIIVNGREGTVRDISVFYTTITTIDNRNITLPNGKITNESIENWSANDVRRVTVPIGLSYDADIDKAKQALLTAAENTVYTVDSPGAEVIVDKYSDSSIGFSVRVWCKPENYWDVLYDLNEKIKAALDENGITIPYPQLDVHFDKDFNKAKTISSD